MTAKNDAKSKHAKTDSPKSGNNFTTGKPDIKPLPNNPAKNAEKTAPEDDTRRSSKKPHQ